MSLHHHIHTIKIDNPNVLSPSMRDSMTRFLKTRLIVRDSNLQVRLVGLKQEKTSVDEKMQFEVDDDVFGSFQIVIIIATILFS